MPVWVGFVLGRGACVGGACDPVGAGACDGRAWVRFPPAGDVVFGT